jgi:hypothetical protein
VIWYHQRSMGTVLTSFRRPSWRTAASVLALLLLLPGLVERHAGSEAAGNGSGPLAAAFYPDAAHPGLPLHVDRAEQGEEPHCLACLHGLHTRSLQPTRTSGVVPPLATQPLALCTAAPAARRATAPAGGRAPPFS